MYNKAKDESKSIHRRFHSERYIECQSCADTQMDAQPDKNVVRDLIKRVKLYQRKEEYDKGATLLAKAINHYPSTQSLRESLCELLIEAEQYDDAIDTLKELGKGGWNLHSFELMTTALEKSKEYVKLEKELACASFIGFESAILSNLKGVVAYQKKNMGTAISYFDQAMNLDHRYGLAYINCGLLKIENGDVSSGLALLEVGFSKTPCDHSVLASYYSVISEFGDYRGADQLFQQAVQENPECKKLNYLYIDILLQQKKYTEAISAIERAIATFGAKDGILGPSLSIREKIGNPNKVLGIHGKSISLCMIVKNEEKNIAKCLMSVKDLADEIVVVDTGSKDHTKEIAIVFGACIYDFTWNENFADARNESLSKANGDWILILDADEQISKSEHDKILRMVAQENDQPVAYSFTARNYVTDAGVEGWVKNNSDYSEEKGTGWYPSAKVRLFPNHASIHFENIVHETVEKSLACEKIKIIPVDVPIHHFGDLDRLKKKNKKNIYYQLGKKKLSAQRDDLKCLIENAIQASEIKDYQKATELWKIVLGKAPNYAKGFFNLGYVYIQLGQYKQAMRVSRKAIKLDPQLKEAALNLSLCEMRTGNIQTAIRMLEDFLIQYPNHPMAMGNLGVAYCLYGKKKMGVDYLQQVTGMGFNGRDFITQHVRDLEIAGQTQKASALSSMASIIPFTDSFSGIVV